MKFKKKILIFLTGAPAAGKDTQAKILAKKLKAKRITISEVLKDYFEYKKRRFIKIGKTLIDLKKEKENFISGKLVSFKFVSWLVENIIKNNLPLKQNLIIVGGPRSLLEAKNYLNLVKKEKINYLFICLKISEDEIYKRTAKRKRIDDVKEIVKERIENFKKYTLPAIKFLKTKGEILEIDGEGTVQRVHQNIWKEINSRLNL